MIGMNVGDEEVMIFLISRYVMINGRYYRDMLPDQQAEYLPEIFDMTSADEARRVEKLKELFFLYGAIRGIRVSSMSEVERNAIISTGRARMVAFEKWRAEKESAVRAEINERRQARVTHSLAEERRIAAERDAPYRRGVDAVFSIMSRSRSEIGVEASKDISWDMRRMVIEAAQKNAKISPAYVAQILDIKRAEAKKVLASLVEAGELRVRVDGWYERADI